MPTALRSPKLNSPQKEIELESFIVDLDAFDDQDTLSDDSDRSIKYHRRHVWSDCHYWTLLAEVLLSILLLVTISAIFLSTALWMVQPSSIPSKKTPSKTKTATRDRPLTIREQQIQNFINGPGLMLNFHITHHAGTTMCARVGRALGAPGRYCNHPAEDDKNVPTDYPNYDPWKYNDTATNIQLARQAYRFIAWEHRSPTKRSFNITNWEDPNLVSVLVIRDPISRLLAGSGDTVQKYPGLAQSRNESQWWAFAKDERNNNFALRILAGHGCCDNAQTSQQHLDMAKQLVSRFTFILDLACLDENLEALAEHLQFDLYRRRYLEREQQRQRFLKSNHTHLPNSERIPFPEIYQYLKDRNRKDIELYQWAKERSLVPCSDKGES